ncbi:MAG: hypothetical protein HY078_03625 [Elusimicrobia bacterium]|nr:hypothetical protein [Elusimicrobiota bacterium]
MKAAFAAAMLAVAVSQDAVAADRPDTHGMLLVGKNTTFISHLPMFHSPHDYQSIAEVRLSLSGRDPRAEYVADQATTKAKFYTLVPQAKWVLPDQITNKRSFLADIYRGHFERGGEAILEGVTVEIVNVVHFRKFDRSEHANQNFDHPRYIVFGKGGEGFLAHLIRNKPDFDEILEATLSPSATDNRLQAGPQVPLLSKLRPGNSYSTMLNTGSGQERLDIQVTEQIYWEIDDLSH